VTLRSPFPWFGGKSRVAPDVWVRFGDVPNYVEPFAGSLAVLLARPTEPRIETVNDRDCYLSNFWRAVQAEPDAVARFADWPINEADLHARHRWLVDQEQFRERMKTDPDFFDAKIAGWWCWGLCQWIGSGWCSSPEWVGRTNAGRAPRGINTAAHHLRPDLSGSRGVHRRERNLAGAANWQKRPTLARGGRGLHMSRQMPAISGNGGASGAGIHASGLPRKMPAVDRGTDSRLVTTGEAILAWMRALQDRLRRVRVCCGDWSRLTGRSVTECIGVTGIFLDPPYGDVNRDPAIYAHDDLSIANQVRQWAVENGDNPKLRIALCGYEGEHEMPATWECLAWKAIGGYAAAAGNSENAHRERVWFSPHCLKPATTAQTQLFGAAEEARR
jgi:site-specific DNA-adenine methylase